MPARPDVLVLIPELNSPLRIAFQVHVGRIPLQAGQREHLVHHHEDQHILPEWEAFGDTRFGQAVVADLFDVLDNLIIPHNKRGLDLPDYGASQPLYQYHHPVKNPISRVTKIGDPRLAFREHR
jgi:hypothetical protein